MQRVGQAATCSLPRSAASVYCVRSFVPIEKNSTCAASAAGGERRGRHLDHDAHLERGVRCRPRRPGPRRAPRARAGARRTVATIGNMTRMRRLVGRPQDRPQLRVEQRGAREAEADAAHAEERVLLGVLREVGDGLVGAGVERAQQQGPSRRARRPRARRPSACSSSSGIVSRPMKRNSVRNRPTPSAPASRAPAASSGRPMFAATSMAHAVRRWPPASPRAHARPAPTRPARARRRRRRFSSGAGGSTKHEARAPVDRERARPRRCRRSRSPSPTTAGMPSDRARTAACEVGPPCAVAMPTATAGSSPAVSAGVRSRATRMPGRQQLGARHRHAEDPGERPGRPRCAGRRRAHAGSRPPARPRLRRWPRSRRATRGPRARSSRIARRAGVEQGLVLQEEQVRVEDRRLVLAGARDDGVALPPDVLMDLPAAPARAPPPRPAGSAASRGRDLELGGVEMPRRADRDAGRGGEAVQRARPSPLGTA